MKILAIKRGKCLAKQKEWVKKSKKTGSEEKAKGKSQFCFLHNVFARSSNICSNMLVSEQKAAQCSANFKRRILGTRIFMDRSEQGSNGSKQTPSCVASIFESSISFSVFKCTLQFLKFISRFEISFKFLITLQETKSNRISFCNVKCCTYELLGLDQPITGFLQSFNTSQGGKDSVRQGRYCIGRELSVKNETIK